MYAHANDGAFVVVVQMSRRVQAHAELQGLGLELGAATQWDKRGSFDTAMCAGEVAAGAT